MRAGILAPRYLRGGILVAGSAGALLALAGINSAARGPLVLIFLLAAPGLAVASLLRRLDPGARTVVAVTAAIAVNVLVAETMLAAGAWSPLAGLLAIAAISAVMGAIGMAVDRHGPVSPVRAAVPRAPDRGLWSGT
jgi:CHASE2 domain-containing sensor protein